MGASTRDRAVRPAGRAARPHIRLRAALATVAVLAVALYALNDSWWDWVVEHLLGLDPASRLGSGVHFFFYDSVKILLLLAGVIFAVSVLRSFMSVERVRAMLGGRRRGAGNVMAAGLGVVTPFCSCSAVPVFMGFVSAGVPIGVTMSFLIASPLVNEVAIVLLAGMFGLEVALLYAAAGFAIAVLAGLMIGRMRAERWVEPFVIQLQARAQAADPSVGLTWDDRLSIGVDEVRSVLRRIWPYLLIGIGVGAAIHGWAPEDFFAAHAGAGNPFAVVIAVVIAIPLYSNAAGVMPTVQALYDKGLPMGTLLAFMMAVVALSLPEMILLRRVLRPPLIAVFVGVVATGIIAVGYLFNAVLGA